MMLSSVVAVVTVAKSDPGIRKIGFIFNAGFAAQQPGVKRTGYEATAAGWRPVMAAAAHHECMPLNVGRLTNRSRRGLQG